MSEPENLAAGTKPERMVREELLAVRGTRDDEYMNARKTEAPAPIRRTATVSLPHLSNVRDSRRLRDKGEIDLINRHRQKINRSESELPEAKV